MTIGSNLVELECLYQLVEGTWSTSYNASETIFSPGGDTVMIY